MRSSLQAAAAVSGTAPKMGVRRSMSADPGGARHQLTSNNELGTVQTDDSGMSGMSRSTSATDFRGNPVRSALPQREVVLFL